jgi:hypothetical protein
MRRGDVDNVLATHGRHGLRNIDGVKLRLYQEAAATACADRSITAAEDQYLAHLRDVLELHPGITAPIDLNLQRIDIIGRIESGQLPVLQNPGISMQRGETPHFIFDNVQFLQERVLRTYYQGGSSGVSIRIMRGVSYRVGAHRGERVSETGLVHLDTGRLIMTSKRIIFSGPSRGFTLPIAKIVNVAAYSNGASITRDSIAQNNRPFVFIYDDDPELMNVALSAILNA